ncbi:hypothetical protein P170DRAFT_436839 [Aspergillus steynii IBT 23096]|uniref:Uncharacterized protein n=1 Tax=Aspergillus steynii IBT 23096 TaxID=1392250 RepID=A0A2I2G8Q2_9EURO|nr:uncharacterized protein P170DRAFT_436839 [Aspergillus steynii IBT 23096]PLB49223.1 hypothetical protein P170DRAFT_436839 [Aspergillus steynii IBT 23096]
MVLRTRLFTIKYNPRTQIPPVAARYLGSPANPIHPKIAHMYATRDRTELWWRVSAQHLMAYKRVVRNLCLRHIRFAFRQALKDRGFDANGKRIAPATPSPEGQKLPGDAPLTGTVEIVINPRMPREDFSNLQSDMNQTVDNLLRQTQEKKAQIPQRGAGGKRSKWVELAASV